MQVTAEDIESLEPRELIQKYKDALDVYTGGTIDLLNQPFENGIDKDQEYRIKDYTTRFYCMQHSKSWSYILNFMKEAKKDLDALHAEQSSDAKSFTKIDKTILGKILAMSSIGCAIYSRICAKKRSKTKQKTYPTQFTVKLKGKKYKSIESLLRESSLKGLEIN